MTLTAGRARPVSRELEGRVALVTGGSRGIGRAIALDLALHGADVAFTYRADDAAAEDAARELGGLGRPALAVRADGAVAGAADQTVASVLARFGKLDVLVNNAGLNRDAVSWKLTDVQWDEVIAADLTATFRYCRAAIPTMRGAGYGRIVNVASINGLRGKFGQANYAAAKAGVIGLTRSIAREVGAFGITANCVAPGLIETEMVRRMPDEQRERSVAETVVGRIGQPEDVAAAVTFLAGERARHITGVVLQVDGGQRM